MPGEALIRVRAAGICNTDLEITKGYKGFAGVLGHEFVGEVLESQDRRWVGQRVCGEINVSCGACRMCAAGMPSHCERRTVIGIMGRHGAFAEYLTLPLVNLHPLPPQLSDEEAVSVEPLAAAFQILQQIHPDPRERVVVLGDGKLGILCAQVMALTGANLLVVGKHRQKLEILDRLGIATGQLADPLPQEVDIVVEATGSPGGLELALSMARPRGTVVLKSTTAAAPGLDLSPIVVKELTVVGSRCGPFPRAISALVHGEVDVRPLLSVRYPLEHAIQAMQRAEEPGTLKVLLHPMTAQD